MAKDCGVALILINEKKYKKKVKNESLIAESE
jgi:hypothetical protein